MPPWSWTRRAGRLPRGLRSAPDQVDAGLRPRLRVFLRSVLVFFPAVHARQLSGVPRRPLSSPVAARAFGAGVEQFAAGRRCRWRIAARCRHLPSRRHPPHRAASLPRCRRRHLPVLPPLFPHRHYRRHRPAMSPPAGRSVGSGSVGPDEQSPTTTSRRSQGRSRSRRIGVLGVGRVQRIAFGLGEAGKESAPQLGRCLEMWLRSGRRRLGGAFDRAAPLGWDCRHTRRADSRRSGRRRRRTPPVLLAGSPVAACRSRLLTPRRGGGPPPYQWARYHQHGTLISPFLKVEVAQSSPRLMSPTAGLC